MNIHTCKKCKHVIWLVALGLGVRCKHEENQQHKLPTDKNLPVVVSRIPDGCIYYEKRGQDGN
jgi:hypothetical protein